MRPLIAAFLLVLAVMKPFPAGAGEQLVPGALEVVAELPINPGNLAVTAEGRVFATVHQFRRADAQLIEVTGPDSYRPWPDAAWNALITNVTNVRFPFSDPDLFWYFQVWDLGIDDVHITFRTVH